MGDFLTQYAAQLIAAASALAGAYGLWHANRAKTRADERIAANADATAKEKAADDRLKIMLDAQRADFEAIVSPLRADVEGLRREVSSLHAAIDALRARYRVALDYIRQLRVWAGRHTDADTVPEVPQTIADEV